MPVPMVMYMLLLFSLLSSFAPKHVEVILNVSKWALDGKLQYLYHYIVVLCQAVYSIDKLFQSLELVDGVKQNFRC